LRLCKHFPLWTNVLRNIFQSPFKRASSAAVENDFKELKTQILKFDVCPMIADKFVIKHLESINGNVKLFKSKQLRNNIDTEQLELDKQNNSPIKAYEGIKNESYQKYMESEDLQKEESDDQFENSNEKENGTDELVDESDDSIDAIENWKGKGKESQGNILV